MNEAGFSSPYKDSGEDGEGEGGSDVSGVLRLDESEREERNVACKGEMESEREMEPCKLRYVRFLICT